MSEPFLAEIRAFSFGFVPQGWLACAGQLLPINQNQALFSLLGTTYGGDGFSTFALPDLRGRSGVHVGDGLVLGESAGEEAHALSVAEAPQHSTAVDVRATTRRPAGATPARGGAYTAPPDGSSGSVGGSGAHENRAPFLAMTLAIAVQGIFPSRN
jgi:microcystin-dependent protein